MTGLGDSLGCKGWPVSGVGICGCIGMGWGGTVGFGTRFGAVKGAEGVFWALVG